LLRHTARLPCSLALLRAGTRIAISKAIIAITISNSISVNPAVIIQYFLFVKTNPFEHENAIGLFFFAIVLLSNAQ
jgi:hypothetical protein